MLMFMKKRNMTYYTGFNNYTLVNGENVNEMSTNRINIKCDFGNANMVQKFKNIKYSGYQKLDLSLKWKNFDSKNNEHKKVIANLKSFSNINHIYDFNDNEVSKSVYNNVIAKIDSNKDEIIMNKIPEHNEVFSFNDNMKIIILKEEFAIMNGKKLQFYAKLHYENCMVINTTLVFSKYDFSIPEFVINRGRKIHVAKIVLSEFNFADDVYVKRFNKIMNVFKYDSLIFENTDFNISLIIYNYPHHHHLIQIYMALYLNLFYLHILNKYNHLSLNPHKYLLYYQMVFHKNYNFHICIY